MIKWQKNVVTQFELGFELCDIGILTTGIEHQQRELTLKSLDESKMASLVFQKIAFLHLSRTYWHCVPYALYFQIPILEFSPCFPSIALHESPVYK